MLAALDSGPPTTTSQAMTATLPTAGVRTELSPEELGAIVAVLGYLISNFQHLNSSDGSPLYNTAATHTLE